MAEDDDFGDFQTCKQEEECDNSYQSTPNVNVFELNSNDFDDFLRYFDKIICDLFPMCDKFASNTIIHSQEDSISDCPFWCDLLGNFKNIEFTPFKRSESFCLFMSALPSSNTFRNDPLLDDNKQKNHEINEDSLASEMDMHSLILDTSSDSVYRPADDTINADRIIEEIEHIMQNNDANNQDLVALNASTLLNSALNSWARYQDLFSDDDDETEFRSLPVTINSPINKPELGNRLKNSVTANSLESSQASTSEISNISQNSFIERIQQLSIVKLNELLMEMESIIQIKSEILIQELALRDELENEKELKNTFISSLLNVQNKRRLLIGSNGRKRSSQNNNKNLTRRKSDVGTSSTSTFLPSRFVPNLNSLKETLGLRAFQSSNNSSNSVYLTTVIPYNSQDDFLDNSTLEMLIKLLNAMNENSSTVPQLLTDYILKVICT